MSPADRRGAVRSMSKAARADGCPPAISERPDQSNAEENQRKALTMPETPSIFSSAGPDGQCDPLLDALVAMISDAARYTQGKLTPDEMMEAASAFIWSVDELRNPKQVNLELIK